MEISQINSRAATCKNLPSNDNRQHVEQKAAKKEGVKRIKSFIHSFIQSVTPHSHCLQFNVIPGGGNCPLFDMKSEQGESQRDKVRKGVRVKIG